MATKEEIYDSQIEPMMLRIAAICEEHNIPIACMVTLDNATGSHATTVIVTEEMEPSSRLRFAAYIMASGDPDFEEFKAANPDGGTFYKDERR